MFAAGIEEIVPTTIKATITTRAKVDIPDTNNRYGHELISNYRLKISQLAIAKITTKLLNTYPGNLYVIVLLDLLVKIPSTTFYNIVSQYGNQNGPIQTHFIARIVHNTIRTIKERIQANPANTNGQNRVIVEEAMATMVFDMEKYFIVPVYHNFLFGNFQEYQVYAHLLLFNGGRYTHNIADLIIQAVTAFDLKDEVKSNTIDITQLYKWTSNTDVYQELNKKIAALITETTEKIAEQKTEQKTAETAEKVNKNINTENLKQLIMEQSPQTKGPATLNMLTQLLTTIKHKDATLYRLTQLLTTIEPQSCNTLYTIVDAKTPNTNMIKWASAVSNNIIKIIQAKEESLKNIRERQQEGMGKLSDLEKRFNVLVESVTGSTEESENEIGSGMLQLRL